MSLLVMLRALSAEEYWFNGSIYSGEPSGARPFVSVCSFQVGSGVVKVVGTYRPAGQSDSHPFSAEARFAADPPWFSANSPHTESLAGGMVLVADSLELLAAATSAKALACRVQVQASGNVHASGSVKLDDATFSFVANGVPGVDRGTLSNVVGIFGAGRA